MRSHSEYNAMSGLIAVTAIHCGTWSCLSTSASTLQSLALPSLPCKDLTSTCLFSNKQIRQWFWNQIMCPCENMFQWANTWTQPATFRPLIKVLWCWEYVITGSEVLWCWECIITGSDNQFNTVNIHSQQFPPTDLPLLNVITLHCLALI